ncbi:MAG: hypothetical protein AABP62_23205 [Planctomycetota bacterium]
MSVADTTTSEAIQVEVEQNDHRPQRTQAAFTACHTWSFVKLTHDPRQRLLAFLVGTQNNPARPAASVAGWITLSIESPMAKRAASQSEQGTIRVFIASPGDLTVERRTFKEVIQ